MKDRYFAYNPNNRQPRKGDLLISEPLMPDNNFSRTVVLLCEHNDEGSFGFVVNRSSEVKLKDVMEDFDNAPHTVFVGGPVQQDSLHYIHCVPDLLDDSIEIKKGVYWGGNFEQLKAQVQRNSIAENEIKFFIGYSGWGEGQLMDEMKLNSWIVYKKTTSEQIFNTKPEELWKLTLENMGGKYRMYSNYPVDPRLN